MPSPDEFKQFNRPLIAEFRANAGKVNGWHSLLLLTTVGAKSSQPHTTPLVYSTDGDRIIIVAAARGAPKHPDWYHNLLAHPEVTVELDGESQRMRAVVAEGQEYERLFIQHAEQVPAVVEYQGKTARRIPIVILEQID
jgi:deazaflavin-dependent oxidoreductase (nitroreductase family)